MIGRKTALFFAVGLLVAVSGTYAAGSASLISGGLIQQVIINTSQIVGMSIDSAMILIRQGNEIGDVIRFGFEQAACTIRTFMNSSEATFGIVQNEFARFLSYLQQYIYVVLNHIYSDTAKTFQLYLRASSSESSRLLSHMQKLLRNLTVVYRSIIEPMYNINASGLDGANYLFARYRQTLLYYLKSGDTFLCEIVTNSQSDPSLVVEAENVRTNLRYLAPMLKIAGCKNAECTRLHQAIDRFVARTTC